LHIGPDLGLKLESGGFGVWFNAVGGISWIIPTTPQMDVSIEVALPVISYKDYGKGNLGFLQDGTNWRVLFHVYLF
jgi:hypothetical protein